MKTTTTTRCIVHGLCIAMTMGILSTTARATDGTWASGSIGWSWATATNWVGSAVPGGIGSAITFPKALTSDRTVTLDGSYTIGSLTVDLSGSKWFFQKGTGGTLTLDTGTALQPTITIITNGANRADFYVPIAGTNGFVLSGTNTAGIRLIATNTYSGVTHIGAAALHVQTGKALGNSPRVELESPYATYGAILDLADGTTITNTVFMHGYESGTKGGASIYTENIAGAADPTVRINGNIIVSGTSVSPNQIFHALNTDLIINGNISGDGTTGGIGLRGSAGRIVVNGTINILGVVTMNDVHTNIFNTSGNIYGGDLFFYSGSLIMGATNALCPSYGVNLSQYGSSAATLDLNGYDQTIRGILNGLPFHRITSATNATLTLDTGTNSYNFTGGGTIDGAVCLVKRGAGTQQFGASNTNIMTGGTFVYGGTNRMNGYSRANVTVAGGTFYGSGWLEYRMGATPDQLTLSSGTLNVSNLNIRFTGTPTLKTYTVVDYSAGGTFVTYRTTNFFASVTNMPSGYKWLNDTSAKKLYLFAPPLGTTMMFR